MFVRYYAFISRESGNKRCFCPYIRPSVRSSIAYIAKNSRTRRPSVPKFGTKVPHLRCDSHTSFKVKRSKVRVTDWRPNPAATLFVLVVACVMRYIVCCSIVRCITIIHRQSWNDATSSAFNYSVCELCCTWLHHCICLTNNKRVDYYSTRRSFCGSVRIGLSAKIVRCGPPTKLDTSALVSRTIGQRDEQAKTYSATAGYAAAAHSVWKA